MCFYFLLVWFVVLIGKPKNKTQFNWQVGIACLTITVMTTLINLPSILVVGSPKVSSVGILTAVISSLVVYAILWLIYRKDFVEQHDKITHLGLATMPSAPSNLEPPLGRYINSVNGAEYIDLKADGTFHLQERTASLGGTFVIEADVLTMSLPSGQTATARMQVDRFTDGDGKTWIDLRTLK